MGSQRDAYPGYPQQDAYPGYSQGGYPGFQQDAQGGPMAPPGANGSGSGKTGGGKLKGKRGLLIGGAAAVAVIAAAGVIVAPKLLGPTDPGCKAYTGTALTAYNNTIDDLNAQASQAKLTSDMNTAIAELRTAAGQAQSASAKSALNGLLTELTSVRTDVQSGSVPSTTVSQLNAAANKADSAC
jgi:hypothetical protein